MSLKRIKDTIKERWKYYLVGYLIGYVCLIRQNGGFNNFILFPIKLIVIGEGLGLGTAIFYGIKKIPLYEVPVRSIKYVIFFILLVIVVQWIGNALLSSFGIDIWPLLE